MFKRTFHVLSCDLCQTIWLDGVKLLNDDAHMSPLIEEMVSKFPDSFEMIEKDIDDGEEWEDWSEQEDIFEKEVINGK